MWGRRVLDRRKALGSAALLPLPSTLFPRQRSARAHGSTGAKIALMTSTVTRNTGATIKYIVITAVLVGLSFLCFRAMIGRSGLLWLLCLAGGLGFAVFAFGSILVARDLAGTAT